MCRAAGASPGGRRARRPVDQVARGGVVDVDVAEVHVVEAVQRRRRGSPRICSMAFRRCASGSPGTAGRAWSSCEDRERSPGRGARWSRRSRYRSCSRCRRPRRHADPRSRPAARRAPSPPSRACCRRSKWTPSDEVAEADRRLPVRPLAPVEQMHEAVLDDRRRVEHEAGFPEPVGRPEDRVRRVAHERPERVADGRPPVAAAAEARGAAAPSSPWRPRPVPLRRRAAAELEQVPACGGHRRLSQVTEAAAPQSARLPSIALPRFEYPFRHGSAVEPDQPEPTSRPGEVQRGSSHT